MEHTTAFDLNRAIGDWRDRLAQSPAFLRENLNELESHLRDSVASLQTIGLSAEEAFLVAVKRLGGVRSLEAEYAKSNRQAVWFDRLLWVLLGLQGWKIISLVAAFVAAVGSVLVPTMNRFFAEIGFQISIGDLRGYHFMFGSSLAILLVVLIWALFIRPRRSAESSFQRLLQQPEKLAVILFLMCVVLSAAANGLWWTCVQPAYAAGLTAPAWSQVIRNELTHLPEYFILALLTFFVARKRLRLARA